MQLKKQYKRFKCACKHEDTNIYTLVSRGNYLFTISKPTTFLIGRHWEFFGLPFLLINLINFHTPKHVYINYISMSS